MLARLSLQVRLVLTLLLLLAVALTVTGFTATTLLRGYLADRVDREMRVAVDRLGGEGRPGAMHGGPMRQDLPSRYVLVVLGPAGDPVLTVADPVDPAEPPDLSGTTPEVAAERGGTPYSVTAEDGTTWRVLLQPLDAGRTLALTTSLGDVQATGSRLGRIVLAVDLAVVLLAALVGAVAVRGSLRPLARIEETAEAIAGGDLSRRVPEEGSPRTEVGRLSRALNGMLAQIESAFAARTESEGRMRRFMADASHELRTPLTSIRGFAELYRQGAVTDKDDMDRVMGRIEDEAVRMGGLVEDLLLLARLDAQRPLRREPVDLVVLAADAVHDARASDHDHRVLLDLPDEGEDGAEDGVVVPGDEERLRQVVLNLLVNALRHTPPGTTVTVRVRTAGESALLEVEDDGPGIPEPDQDTLFDGFTRPDPARSRGSGGGAGLGLTIVAALVRAHGGEVTVTSAAGAGATFRVRLPRR